MMISRLHLKNWRNFRITDVELSERTFLVGPNASGKSNLLDVFRFLRDIAKEGGGFQQAVKDRGGISKIRCLAARSNPNVEMEVHLRESQNHEILWRYAISIKQESRGNRQPLLVYERVWRNEELLLDRPDQEDNTDKERLTQTHLEQVNSNAGFRELANFFGSVLYLHLVPQLLRFPNSFSGPGLPGDPFGRGFLERVAKTPEKTRNSRLKKVEEALRLAVPQLEKLSEQKDDNGVPHLEVIYTHWRPNAGKQREDQFSDGTLRLIGLLWSLLEGDSMLLLEEPELSLHSGIIKKLPGLLHRMQRQRKRQVILSTHSGDLLSATGIGPEEVLLLHPSKEGTKVLVASEEEEIMTLLEGGLNIGEAVLPRTMPGNVDQLESFR